MSTSIAAHTHIDFCITSGPGPEACLTRMIHEGTAYVGVKTVSVEANTESAATCAQFLNSIVGQSAAVVIQGLSSDTTVVELIMQQYADIRPDAVISELIGFLASSEGVVGILADVQKNIVARFTPAPKFFPSKFASVSTRCIQFCFCSEPN